MRDEVNLEIPAVPEYMLLARLVVSGLCARLQFPVDRLEDAKVAVAEACLMLMQRGCAALRVTLTPGEGQLAVRVEASGQQSAPEMPDVYDQALSPLLLQALTANLAIQDNCVQFVAESEPHAR